ncbi:HAMP domain-containing sensor histidine kinase [Bacillus sp. JJ722]|uniref:HAMP domain-containing sensor histidine kinase n=1 Tax=Bacillus sp. JJ722 TaxID=3122973 RepID=UPI00300065E4
MKFFRSLLAKYMLIIFMALILIQLSYLLIAIFVSSLTNNIDDEKAENMDMKVVEEQWHNEANKIQNASKATIKKHFSKWKQQYPEASMFWINERGILVEELDVKEQLPTQWTPTYTAKFIKEHYDNDPFTVIAFVGNDENKGFVVLQVPRDTFDPPVSKIYDEYGNLLFIGVLSIILLFITVSFLFFRSIRKRLIQLQDAMEIRDVDGLPIEIDLKKDDEIGQLEQTFNQMVFELRESKKREQDEEQLRRELIANLSHDLRTPLTKIRAQTYSIVQEELSQEGKQAVTSIEASIENIDRLIENLMSYTLLMASKYKLDSKEIDVVRFVRQFFSSWYPVFEKEGFEIEVELSSFEKANWMIDPIWFGRILDNLFQNVLRHAKEGLYIKVKTESNDSYDAIIISDRGEGMKKTSSEKGAGIGLSIVEMMVKGMNLDWDIETSAHGTNIQIKNYK